MVLSARPQGGLFLRLIFMRNRHKTLIDKAPSAIKSKATKTPSFSPPRAPPPCAGGPQRVPCKAMESALHSLTEQVRAAAAHPRPLRISGGGSKDFHGPVPPGDLLDTRAYQGIVSYEPSELVVTARAGTPLAELEAVL